MRKGWYIAGTILLTLGMVTTNNAATSSYLTQSEYSDLLYDNYTEDRGIVVENAPELGYLVYKNNKGQVITRNYYSGEVTVEKQPYYEEADRIGYLDELFPNFEFDPRDTDMSQIGAGDCIYIRMNAEGYITYISAYNDYVMRYGKVISFNYDAGATSIQLQDEKGVVYYYELDQNTPVTKGKKSCSLSTIKNGEWAKLLVSQKILGEGIVDEQVLEIVLDNDTRVISNVYRGQITSLDSFKKTLNVKNIQSLGKVAWSNYGSLKGLGIDTKTAEIYHGGNRVSADYLKRYMVNSDGYAYIAAENYRGKENAVKLNLQGEYQVTLPTTKIISSTLSSVKLLSGENLGVSNDTILIRDNRLVDMNSVMVGDSIQAVVAANEQLAVGFISSEPVEKGSLSIYRGRVKKVKGGESFQVETFSMLEDNKWYYYPTPQTFTIDGSTKFLNASGIVEGGVNSFLSYGKDSTVGKVYTIIASGEHAYMVVDMPYATESIKGEVYAHNSGSIDLKDVYYFNTSTKKWMEYSKKNVGATVNLLANSVIIKNGKIVPVSSLEQGDEIRVMVDTNIKKTEGAVTGYILVVEN